MEICCTRAVLTGATGGPERWIAPAPHAKDAIRALGGRGVKLRAALAGGLGAQAKALDLAEAANAAPRVIAAGEVDLASSMTQVARLLAAVAPEAWATLAQAAAAEDFSGPFAFTRHQTR